MALPRYALSIRQPWAWAILNGKDVENRSWSTDFRGPVCIHASKGMTHGEFFEALNFMQELVAADLPDLKTIERGGIVGTARVVDCVEESPSPWFFGRYGFVLADVQAVPFVETKGALGFFDWESVARKV